MISLAEIYSCIDEVVLFGRVESSLDGLPNEVEGSIRRNTRICEVVGDVFSCVVFRPTLHKVSELGRCSWL